MESMQDDQMITMIEMTNYVVVKILVDEGISTNILYYKIVKNSSDK